MAQNSSSNGANLEFEADLWRATDALRSNMDAAEYKHVVLISGEIRVGQVERLIEEATC